VRDKLTVIPYAQYIIGICVSLAFQACSHVPVDVEDGEKFAKNS